MIQPRFRRVASTLALAVAMASPAQALDIIINAGPNLTANAPALAAFERAAQQWENTFVDPIDVFIDVDLGPLPAGVLGGASSTRLEAGHDFVVGLLTADAANEPDDAVVLTLPGSGAFSANVPAGYSLTGSLAATTANFKAVGVSQATITGITGTTLDGVITMSNTEPFDFDNTNGGPAGSFDFESVAVHEIAHILGVTSVVDVIDRAIFDGDAPSAVSPRVMDLFRFGSAPGDFTNDARELVPGNAQVFSDTALAIAMSEGMTQGDGRQASHWKDDQLGGVLYGNNDPTFLDYPNADAIVPISPNDIRLLDVIGYEYVPEPGTGTMALIGFVMMAARHRRSSER